MIDLEDVERRWKDGESATEIGKLYKVSRNAICGYAYRKGWKRSPEAVAVTAAIRTKRALMITGNGSVMEKSTPRPPLVKTKPFSPVEGSLGLRIIDAPRFLTGCKWPIATPGPDGAETRFCCIQTEATYCQAHALIAYSSAPKMNGKQFARSLRRYA